MACVKRLKADLVHLQELFPPTHRIFRVLRYTMDELECQFTNVNQNASKAFKIVASMPEEYPQAAPLWFEESGDSTICSILESLHATAKPDDKLILEQVRILVTSLCSIFDVPIPSEVNKIPQSSTISRRRDMIAVDADEGNDSDIEIIDAEKASSSAGLSMSTKTSTSKKVKTTTPATATSTNFSPGNSSATTSTTTIIKSASTSAVPSSPMDVDGGFNVDDEDDDDDDDPTDGIDAEEDDDYIFGDSAGGGASGSGSKADGSSGGNSASHGGDGELTKEDWEKLERLRKRQNPVLHHSLSVPAHSSSSSGSRTTTTVTNSSNPMQQGSAAANDRLMKELKDIYKSKHKKSGEYEVELMNENLYEWSIKLKSFDSDSALQKDLVELKKRTGQDHIHLHIRFKDTFPYTPPFVRVVSPIIQGGYVTSGGAICMEVLTTQGWSSAYTMENLLVQLSATLVKGRARICFGNTSGGSGPGGAGGGHGGSSSSSSASSATPQNTYTLARAEESFRALTRIHEKSGWYTPPMSDG